MLRRLAAVVAVVVRRLAVRVRQVVVVDAAHERHVAARARRERGHVLHEAQRARVAQDDAQAVVLGLDAEEVAAVTSALARGAVVDRRVGVGLVLGRDVRLEAATV